MAIDTLQLSKDLQDVEFTRDQADALAQIFLRYSNEELEGKLRKEFARLEQRLDALQSSREAPQSSQEALQRDLEALKSRNQGLDPGSEGRDQGGGRKQQGRTPSGGSSARSS